MANYEVEFQRAKKTTVQPNKRFSVQRMTRKKKLIVENNTTFKRRKDKKDKKWPSLELKAKRKKKGLKTTLQKY